MHRVQPTCNGTVTYASVCAVTQSRHVMPIRYGIVRNVAVSVKNALTYALGNWSGTMIHVLASVLKARALLEPSHCQIASALKESEQYGHEH